MRVFLDTCIVIYLVEKTPVWGPRCLQRIDELSEAGHEFVVSDLVRLEARVGPLSPRDEETLAQFDTFFGDEDICVAGITVAMCDHAAEIRAERKFRTVGALHLAAAVEAGREVLLTNDGRLKGFGDLKVEVLGEPVR